jgi:hypothetical protein
LAIRRLAILLFILLQSGLLCSASPLPCATAAQYRALLVHVEQQVEQHVEQQAQPPDVSWAELADTVPAQCEFAAGGRNFHLSNFELRRQLREIGHKPAERAARLNALQDDLRQRLGGIDAYERPVDPTAIPKLQTILRQRQFRQVGGQNASELLKQWAFGMLKKILSRIFKDPAQVVLGSKIIAWTLCILVAGFILLRLYRWAMRERPPEAVREVIPFAPSSQGWRDWLRQARAAVERGELREAVHAAYWAAISHLESSGAWRPDRARTPREYLRLMKPSDPALLLLADLTRDFEVVWYGNHPPALTEWESFLAKVERIGCR